LTPFRICPPARPTARPTARPPFANLITRIYVENLVKKGITLAKINKEFLSRHDILSRMDYFYI